MKLNPADQFNANKKSVAAVLEHYALRLISFETAKSGIENTTLIVDTSKGKFVVRIYRQNKKSDVAINEENKFTQYLAQASVPTPKIIPNLLQKYLTHIFVDDLRWQVILMEYMAGVHAKHYSMPLINSMATIQAKMHSVGEDYKYGGEKDLNRLSELRETVIIKKIIKDASLDSRLLAFLKRAEHYVLPLPSALPTGICHLDYSKDNVLINDKDEVIAVLDFDDMEIAPYAVCLGFALYHLRYGNANKTEQEEYLKQYKTVRDLSKLEESILPGVELFRHYFLGSLQIFHQHRTEEDILNYLEVEQDLLQQAY